MIANDPLLQLVDRIYEGAVNPQSWPDILEAITAHFGVSKGRLFTAFVAPDRGGLGISVGVPEAALTKWAARYMPHDIWAQAAVAKGLMREGTAFLGTDLVPEHQFLESIIYKEHLSELGVARLLSAVIFDQDSPGSTTTLLSVYRSLEGAPFSLAERDEMLLLLPHLSRSLGVMYRLRDAELKAVANLAALDPLARAIVLFDRSGAVVHSNISATRLLERVDGLSLAATSEGTRMLRADSQAVQLAIDEALRLALHPDELVVPHFSNSIAVNRPSGSRPYVLQVAPLHHANAFASPQGEPGAIVFISEPDRRVAIDPSALANLYGITPAEARLAEMLCAGETISGASVQIGISETTAKTQLASLFQKTSTNRQADLVRLLISLSADRR